jgi:hypothetical protein
MSEERFRTLVGFEAGRLASGQHMTAVGHGAGKTAADKTLVAIGFDAAKYNTGQYVTVVGYASASHNSGSSTITIGVNANKYGTGDGNIVIGNHSFGNFVEDEPRTAEIAGEDLFRVPGHGYPVGRQYLFHLSSTGQLPKALDQEIARAPLLAVDEDHLKLTTLKLTFPGEGTLTLRRVTTPYRNNIVIGHGIAAVEDDLIQIGTAAHKRFYTPPPVETDAHFRTAPRTRATLPPPAVAKEGAFLYCRDARGEGLPGLVYCDGRRWLRVDTHQPV